jgi:phosphate transport system substrate-binding protein
VWLATALLALGCHTSPVLMPKTEARPPAYAPRETARGQLHIGADPDAKALVGAWSLAFRKLHPDVAITLGQSEDPLEAKAFVEGGVGLTVLGRKLANDEVARFQKRTGRSPQRILVAVEPLAVLVNAQNPLDSLRLEQLNSLYSAHHNLTHAPYRWWDLGLEGAWANRKITVQAPMADSARCAALREQALQKADVREGVARYADARAMQEALASDLGGIAVGPMQSLPSRVKVLSLVIPGSAEPVPPDAESIRAGRYPLVRYLYLYADLAPGTPLPTAAAEFVRFCLSKEGQDLLPGFGLVPVPADVAKAGLSRLAPS